MHTAGRWGRPAPGGCSNCVEMCWDAKRPRTAFFTSAGGGWELVLCWLGVGIVSPSRSFSTLSPRCSRWCVVLDPEFHQISGRFQAQLGRPRRCTCVPNRSRGLACGRFRQMEDQKDGVVRTTCHPGRRGPISDIAQTTPPGGGAFSSLMRAPPGLCSRLTDVMIARRSIDGPPKKGQQPSSTFAIDRTIAVGQSRRGQTL